MAKPNQPPIAKANGPYVGDEGSAITFDGTTSYDPDGDALEYRWDFNNDGVWDTEWSTEPTANYTWGDDYTGIVKLEVSDGELTATDTAAITVLNVPPTVEAGSDQEVFAGDTVQFNGSFTDPGWLDTHTILWDFGDGTNASGTLTPSHTYYTKGVYTVSLTVTDDDEGVCIDTLQVTAKPIPATVRIEPETLNLSSKGEFTAFINLPESYKVEDIDLSTVSCEGAQAVKGMISKENGGTYITKFNRQDLVNVPTGEPVSLSVIGKVFYNLGLADFEGEDAIKVINETE